jgi:MinD-like ATPase involved in chromosome partitioning or flagellar assembly
MCEDLDLKLIAQLPHDPRLAKALDMGEDFLAQHPDTPAAKAFVKLAKDVEELCSAKTG